MRNFRPFAASSEELPRRRSSGKRNPGAELFLGAFLRAGQLGGFTPLLPSGTMLPAVPRETFFQKGVGDKKREGSRWRRSGVSHSGMPCVVRTRTPSSRPKSRKVGRDPLGVYFQIPRFQRCHNRSRKKERSRLMGLAFFLWYLSLSSFHCYKW